MKLEVGKSYKNRGGSIISIHGYASVHKTYRDINQIEYYPDGKVWKNRESQFDLVEEFVISSNIKEITTEDINNAAMNWYTNNFKHSNVIPSIKSSWNAAIEWYKSQLNQE